MSAEQKDESYESVGQLLSLARGGVEPSEYRILTPDELLIDGQQFVVVRCGNRPNHPAKGVEWQVSEPDLTPLGVMESFAGFRRLYHGIDGAAHLYVSARFVQVNGLDFAQGRDDTVTQASVAKFIDLTGHKYRDPYALQEESESTVVSRQTPNKLGVIGALRERGKRLVGALTVALVLAASAFVASHNGTVPSDEAARPTPAASGAGVAPPVVPDLTPPVGNREEPPGVEEPPVEVRPSLRLDYNAPTVWAMFADAVGEQNALAELNARAAALNKLGYNVAFIDDPDNPDPNFWWITIVDPDGKTYYEDNESVARLLAGAL